MNSRWLALIGAGVVLTACGGSDKAAAPVATGSTATAPAGASTVSFDDVTVTKATDLTSKPAVTVKSATKPAALEVKDLVVGTGAAANPSSTVTVQYVGVRYADGKQFDASWDNGGATSFPLQQVVPGFTQGIGGTTAVPAMKVGGRRIMILPAALGYGAKGTPDGSIPPNSPIVFVVDLVAVK